LNDLKKKSINLEFEGDQTVTFISDEILITFILKRIIENAIKYSYVGGNIIFKCFLDENKNIILTTEDFGVGMSNRVMEDIFTLNEVNHTGTLNEKGAGISLAIINDLSKLISSSIEIASTENDGTQVEIKLPNS
jgi:signal transduction histidine kinase